MNEHIICFSEEDIEHIRNHMDISFGKLKELMSSLGMCIRSEHEPVRLKAAFTGAKLMMAFNEFLEDMDHVCDNCEPKQTIN